MYCFLRYIAIREPFNYFVGEQYFFRGGVG